MNRRFARDFHDAEIPQKNKEDSGILHKKRMSKAKNQT
jgi:hypothetical protein